MAHSGAEWWGEPRHRHRAWVSAGQHHHPACCSGGEGPKAYTKTSSGSGRMCPQLRCPDKAQLRSICVKNECVRSKNSSNQKVISLSSKIIHHLGAPRTIYKMFSYFNKEEAAYFWLWSRRQSYNNASSLPIIPNYSHEISCFLFWTVMKLLLNQLFTSYSCIVKKEIAEALSLGIRFDWQDTWLWGGFAYSTFLLSSHSFQLAISTAIIWWKVIKCIRLQYSNEKTLQISRNIIMFFMTLIFYFLTDKSKQLRGGGGVPKTNI